jgi:Uncharacterized conserved protein
MNTHASHATQTRAMPAIFVSHGSPDTAIADTEAAAFLREAARDLPRPKAIVVASAHFEVSGGVAVSADAKPETIHDFGGFQPELYQMQYPAPGEPTLARDIAQRLTDAGFSSNAVEGRGFDHGVWVPLILMYPGADIPVVSVSVDPNKDPDHHFRLGRALAGLANEGVLVIGSGSFTHNLPEAFANLRRGIRAADVPAWVSDFTRWMNGRIEAGDVDDLLAYRNRAPNAARNHPTDEHLLPLYVALGAAGEGFRPEKMHESDEFGVLSMTMWRFDPAPAH